MKRTHLNALALSVVVTGIAVACMMRPAIAVSADSTAGARNPVSAAETSREYLGRPALITQVRGNQISRWHGILRTIAADWVVFDVVENAEQNPTPLGRSVMIKTADVTQIEVLMPTAQGRATR